MAAKPCYHLTHGLSPRSPAPPRGGAWGAGLGGHIREVVIQSQPLGGYPIITSREPQTGWRGEAERGRQTDRQTDRQTGRQAGRQTGRQTDRRTDGRTDGQTDR